MIEYTKFDGSEDFDNKEPKYFDFILTVTWVAVLICIAAMVITFIFIPWYGFLVMIPWFIMAIFGLWMNYVNYKEW